ncbi:MAG: transporter [Muribaculaceae bacterium]|nr:transporter [Muribaculaceae bacterium]
MKGQIFRERLKPWMLPIAMLGGLLLHNWINYVGFLTPYLIFAMLLITFCRIDRREFHISGMMGWLLLVQIVGSIGLYLLLRNMSVDVAQSVFICVICPTATAAPVVTGMLGGSVPRLVAYSLLSNVTVALLAPILLAWIGPGDVDLPAATSSIAMHVGPMILGPLLAAFLLKTIAPRVHQEIASRQAISFYIWAISLFIVVGKSVSFIMTEPVSKIGEIIVILIAAGIVCGGQFWIGRRIGHRYGDPISGAQGLGQKNTVLAIWLALTYLNPISSVGPAAYIVWQNTINSIQLYLKQKKGNAYNHADEICTKQPPKI